MPEMKPCPFCGAQGTIWVREKTPDEEFWGTPDWHVGGCEDCGTGFNGSPESIAEMWNRRAE